ncbi:MAG: hypothetical protein ACRC92_07800 [Peptostreptococcaceae bacterium]
MKKALKIFIMSAAASFCLTFALIIINAVMGVFIGLNYYAAIFTLLFIGLSIGLILFDSKQIFSKRKVRKVAKTSNAKRRHHRSNEVRRKIS